MVSSALGAALAADRRCVLLTGDLSLVYDLGGVVALRRHPDALTIVCVNNGGGGIFDFLPVAAHADPAAYEELIATPSGVDLAAVAALGGLRHARASSPAEVRAAAAEPGLVEVRTDRRANVARHRDVFAAVTAAL